MDTLIIYHSYHHKNTHKIVSAMARILKADLRSVFQADKNDIDRFDLIIFASGIYFWHHSKILLDFVDSLEIQKNKKAVIVSTRGLAIVPGKYFHKSLRQKLIAKNFKIVGEFSCPGWDSFAFLAVFGGINKNRPNKNDEKKAQYFVRKLKK